MSSGRLVIRGVLILRIGIGSICNIGKILESVTTKYLASTSAFFCLTPDTQGQYYCSRKSWKPRCVREAWVSLFAVTAQRAMMTSGRSQPTVFSYHILYYTQSLYKIYIRKWFMMLLVQNHKLTMIKIVFKRAIFA